MNRLANYTDDDILYALTPEDVETVIEQQGVNKADLPEDYMRHVKKALEYLDWAEMVYLGLVQAMESKKEHE
jgi:hypothetical protein